MSWPEFTWQPNWWQTALIIVVTFGGVYLFGRYVLPRLNRARKIEDKQP